MNWYTILVEAAQEGKLDAADIPTPTIWKGELMMIDEESASRGDNPTALELALGLKSISIELVKHLSHDVQDINKQTVRNLFAKIQILLYAASALRSEVDLDLATLNYVRAAKEKCLENSGHPLKN